LGGLVGKLLGAWISSGKFKPVPQILLELPPTEQKKLYDETFCIISHLDNSVSNADQLIALVMKNVRLQKTLTAVLAYYLSKNLKAQIDYGE
ncbi:CS012 protein, partial [Scytalopus superciliaris]|nr:CS012 protein [Scytalopus superciliaris]